MNYNWHCLMGPRARQILYWCMGLGLVLLYVTASVKGPTVNTKRSLISLDKNTRSVWLEQLYRRTPWNHTLQEYNYDGVSVDSAVCPCSWVDDCSSGENGSTYSWKGIFSSPGIQNISAAIEYADTYLCLEEDGYRRVALETSVELNFLIDCFFCNQETYFGSSLMKKNIMTAGTVYVTKENMTAEEALWEHGTWSTWDDMVIDVSVPSQVVLLNQSNGTPVNGSPYVPVGTYSIFLVGNDKQLCEGDTFYTWGLMTHTAGEEGSLENLVGYVACEKLNDEFFTDTTYTSFKTSSVTSATLTHTSTESSTTSTATSSESIATSIATTTESTATSTATSTESATTSIATSAESTTTSTATSIESTITSTDTTTGTSTPSIDTSPTSTDSSPETSTTSTDSSTETSSKDSSTETSTTSRDSSTETSTASTDSTKTSTTSTDFSTETSTTSTDSSTKASTTSTDLSTETSTTSTDSSTETPPSHTSSEITSTATCTDTSSTTTTTTTTTSTTTNTTSTTTVTTSVTTTEECCEVQDESKLLCPGNTLLMDCPEGYSGNKSVECIKGVVVVVEDLCIADWIHNVDSMINAGNDSVVDIAEIVKNETDKETPINKAELTYIVALVTNMTHLLQKQIEAESNNTVKQEMTEQYTFQLVKIEGNLFTYEDTWDSLDQYSSRKLGTSLLHDLEKTGFILAQYVENDQRNFTDPTLNMTVISRPREELAGKELYIPGQISDTFIYLPLNFTELLPPGEHQARLVGYFLEQSASSRALPVGLSKLYTIDEPKEANSFAVSMTLDGLNKTVNFTSLDSSVIMRLHHTYREIGPFYRDIYRDRRKDEVPSRIPGTAKCVYWDPFESSWVTNGCVLLNTTREDTFCSCSHLSIFSIITDVHKYVGRDPVLDILSTVLLSLSCLGLLLTFFTLQFCRGVQTNSRISITKQLSISLFLSHIIIILFLDPDFLKIKEDGCKAVAVTLHYILLASIFWMLAEGLNLFQKAYFVLDLTNYMAAYWMMGYGIPVVVVLVTILTALGTNQWTDESYAPADSEYCWLDTGKGYIWAFTGPLVVVIVVNAILMVLAIYSAANLPVNRKKSLPQKFLLWIKGSFSLNCILGFTWVFGLLYISTNHFFAYVFTIFNASQGVLILIFSCMVNENVRNALIASLPEGITSCLKKKAVYSGQASNMRPSRDTARKASADSSNFNLAHTADHHHHHHHQMHDHRRSFSDTESHESLEDHAELWDTIKRETLQPPKECSGKRLKSRSGFASEMLENSEESCDSRLYRNGDHCKVLSHRNSPLLRRDSESSGQQIFSSLNLDISSSTRMKWERALKELKEQQNLRNPSISHRRVSVQDLRQGPVSTKMSPTNKSPYSRKASEGSCATQISFIADGENSERNSMGDFAFDGSNSSSSSSSYTSWNSALNYSMENTSLTHHTHSDRRNPQLSHIKEEQHTASNCEDQSPFPDILWV